MISLITKLIGQIAESQAFSPDDKLSQMVNEYDIDELPVESLDLVYAARKDDTSYAAFLKLAHERDSKLK